MINHYRPRHLTDALLGLFLFLVGARGEAQTISFNSLHLSQQRTEDNLRGAVHFLSSKRLEGRLTGTKGEQLATQYIANKFLQLGLKPAGDNGTFFQAFHFTSGVSLGPNNAFSITNQKGITKSLILNQDWRPLSFSDTTSFKTTQLIFAGFGITAPALEKLPAYNSYKGLNVKNKWVVVYRYTPEIISAARQRQLNPYSSLRYKAFTAKNHGAAGIIFVSGLNSTAPQALIPLTSDTSLSGSGISAISVKNYVLDGLLKNRGTEFKAWQKALDRGQVQALPTISGIKMLGQIDIKKNLQHGRNVLAKLRCGLNAERMIVVGAHVDHLGRGQLSGSRAGANEVGLIHPGADDNASGVASMLAAAASLSHLKARGRLPLNKDILFAAWSGEEFGILGSSHFVMQLMKTKHKKSLRPAIDVAINLDMVGRLRKHLVLQGTGSSLNWLRMIKSANVKQPISIITQSDPYLPTDTTAFYLHGVPTLNFFTGAHDDYHSPRDLPSSLNYKGMQHISELLVNLILVLENKPNSITYQAVANKNESSEREGKIYLGTIPDYTSSDALGVKLAGVAKNSPAEHAGILPNDVIIKLAGKTIHDIYDYTFALNALPVGEPTKLLVLRGQTKVYLTIIPHYRE